MAIIIILLLILGSSAFLYFKGTIVRSFAVVISAIFACVAAFAYFETLAATLISRGTMVSWAYTISFLSLLFVAFAIFLTLTLLLTRWQVDFGFLPERIVRVVCGIITGFVLAGAILTALAMAPLSAKNPYQRFDPANPDTDKPGKSLLNADGFVTGLFSFTSGGSLKGQTSFSDLHPNFLDHLFLNRTSADVSAITSVQALEIPSKAALWPAPENLKDHTGKPLSPPKSDTKAMIARIGIRQAAAKDAGQFTLSQLSLFCKEKAQPRTAGTVIYPLGYLKTPDRVQVKKLTDKIKLEAADFATSVKWLDFVFDVPQNFTPVMVQFKQNNIAELLPPVTTDQAPPPMPFIPQSECAANIAQLSPLESALLSGIELAYDIKLLEGLSLKIKDAAEWKKYQTEASTKPADFEDDKIIHTQAELIIKESTTPAEEQQTAAEETQPTQPAPTAKKSKARRMARPLPGAKKVRVVSAIGNLLKPIEGYRMLSLKCNNPATGATLKGAQLPILVELAGLTHYPVGVIAAGTVDANSGYELDYCAVPISEDPNAPAGCLTIAKDGTVEKPFPESVWMTEKAKTISEFYVLYLVKPTGNTIITSVKISDTNTPQKFDKYEGLSVK